MSLQSNNLYTATAARHTEHIVAKELRLLGAKELLIEHGAVSFRGSLKTAYSACLWCRTAIRILFPIATFTINNDAELYQQIRAIAWHEHLCTQQTIAVDFTTVNGVISHQQFGAQRVKDGIVDYCRDRDGSRPNVDKSQPDLRISLFLKEREATVSIDLSGESLHRRGYRSHPGPAPLKENLAAAILLRAGWYEIARKGGALLDPMCGSGTFLLEGLMIAADIAPNLERSYFGFLGWKQHDADLWATLKEEAIARKQIGLSKAPLAIGYDRDTKIINLAQRSARQLGLDNHIKFASSELATLNWPDSLAPYCHGLIITNPPYGERLGNEQEVSLTHQWLGQFFRHTPAAWSCMLFTHRPDLADLYGYTITNQYPFMNGPLACRLLGYKPATDSLPATSASKTADAPVDLINRLKKNQQRLKKWLKRNDIHCYRLYDADLPEYAAAIDCYNDWAHIQEYSPPKSIDPSKAEFRKMQIINSVSAVLNLPISRIVIKTRTRQKGTQQYERLDVQGRFINVVENDLLFKINLHDYLDTGLFIDHRLTRKIISSLAPKKRFLNLFCYTGAATIYAASAGASATTSVDLSNTYLQWCEENLHLNNLPIKTNRLIQADCLQWIDQCKESYDLIFLDPPTFSNSKRMDNTLDTQRDHVDLISATMALLAANGTLIFSTNKHKFALAPELTTTFAVTEITKQTTDEDFLRRPLHQCWTFKHR